MHDDEQFTELGRREIWGGEVPFGLRAVDRRLHLHLIGRTGSGKTTLLRQIIASDFAAGTGGGLIDPHGDVANEVLDLVPPHRIDDVCLLDLSDSEHPVSLNVLADVPAAHRHLHVDGIVSALRSIWSDSWGPRMEQLLAKSLAALCEAQNASLLGVPRMLVDETYRDWVVRQVRDPLTRQFWLREWPSYDHRFQAEAASPVLNKMSALLSPAPLRNVLGQVRRSFDPRYAMDSSRILIVNAASGSIGSTNASLIGSLVISLLYTAAMSRADVPEHQRRDFHLIVDEFASFASDNFASMLPQVRKYRLPLVLVSQSLDALRDEVRSAVLANVSNLIVFGVGARNARALSEELGGAFAPEQLIDLPNHHVVARLLHGGIPCEPFRAHCKPTALRNYGTAERVRRRSRERFARPRAEVEAKLERWLK